MWPTAVEKLRKRHDTNTEDLFLQQGDQKRPIPWLFQIATQIEQIAMHTMLAKIF